jgi:hypothetical protein
VAICSSKTSINFYQTTRRQIPEDRILLIYWGTEQVGIAVKFLGCHPEATTGQRFVVVFVRPSRQALGSYLH